MSVCNCNQGRMPCTCKTTEILGKLDHPTACVTSLDADKLRAALKAADDTEAELYAAQDQVTGLQELMRTNTVPAILDTAVRYLVAAADSRYNKNAPTGSPQHGHRIAGRWDGDKTNAKGALCEECAAWNIMRKYAATDIVAEAQVMEDARVTQLLTALKRADGIISMLMPGAAKVFNLDIQELNEGMMEIAQGLASEKGAAPCPSN